MNLKFKSTLTIVVLAMLLLLCALFPNPKLIMAFTVVGSLLIAYQALVILKDHPDQEAKGDYRLP